MLLHLLSRDVKVYKIFWSRYVAGGRDPFDVVQKTIIWYNHRAHEVGTDILAFIAEIENMFFTIFRISRILL